MWKFVALLMCAGCCMTAPVSGQELDGICRLSTDGMQWSGVAISETKILTVAHHKLRVGQVVRAEFGIGQHGAFERVSVKARIRKSDVKKDLCLLDFDTPKFLKVKAYPVGRLQAKVSRTRISGYIMDQPMQLEVPLISTIGQTDGVRVFTFHGKGVAGMSGAPAMQQGRVVAVQFGGGPAAIDAASDESIQEFVAESE